MLNRSTQGVTCAVRGCVERADVLDISVCTAQAVNLPPPQHTTIMSGELNIRGINFVVLLCNH